MDPAKAGGREDRLRVVFLGTSGFAEPILRALAERHRVLLVVSQPARPAGRGRRLRPSRIERLAEKLDLPRFGPERIRRPSAWERIAALAPDALVVADYGQILPARLLAVPRLGSVNVHASLLPELRGAAPVPWAVARSFRRTGVTTMLMDAGLDTGPILLQRGVEIREAETGGSLLARLAGIGAGLLVETLSGLARGEIAPRPQDDAKASAAPRIEKSDLALDWTEGARVLAARIRAFSPAPGAFTAFFPRGSGEPVLLKIHAAEVGTEPAPADASPGTIRTFGPGASRLAVACGGGAPLLPLRVQAAGRRPLEIGDFLRGHPVSVFLEAGEALRAAEHEPAAKGG